MSQSYLWEGEQTRRTMLKMNVSPNWGRAGKLDKNYAIVKSNLPEEKGPACSLT